GPLKKSSDKKRNLNKTEKEPNNSIFDNDKKHKSDNEVKTDDAVSNEEVSAFNNKLTAFTAKMFIDVPPKAFEDFDQGVYTYT
ncbi:4564_t:CDS:2, partial [Scutellospora calospora]